MNTQVKTIPKNIIMTRDEMIKFIKENHFVPIAHHLFADDEYIYSDTNGIIHDENGYIFENWDSVSNMWSGINGIRMRIGGNWENGWYIKDHVMIEGILYEKI